MDVATLDRWGLIVVAVCLLAAAVRHLSPPRSIAPILLIAAALLLLVIETLLPRSAASLGRVPNGAMPWGLLGRAGLLFVVGLCWLRFGTLRWIGTHPTCRRCGYDRRGREVRCPECGTTEAVVLGERRRRWGTSMAALGLTLFGLGWGGYLLTTVNWWPFVPNRVLVLLAGSGWWTDAALDRVMHRVMDERMRLTDHPELLGTCDRLLGGRHGGRGSLPESIQLIAWHVDILDPEQEQRLLRSLWRSTLILPQEIRESEVCRVRLEVVTSSGLLLHSPGYKCHPFYEPPEAAVELAPRADQDRHESWYQLPPGRHEFVIRSVFTRPGLPPVEVRDVYPVEVLAR